VDTETPRPEKLVVDFDTTVNSSPTDISGKGNHGTFYNGAYYSAADKAFFLDGTDDYITSTITPSITGEFIHSYSIWLNFTALEGSYDYPIIIGSIGALNQSSILRTSGGLIGPSFGSGYNLFTSLVPDTNRWYHMVVIYRGGAVNTTNVDYYIDGVKKSIPNQSGTEGTGTLAIDENTLSLGATSTGAEPFKGKMSNFKLYNVALEPSEVKKLYNLGRTGRSMVISDTAVGIGKVPEAQLDVRGNINSDGIMTNKNYMFWATGPTTVNRQNDHPTTSIKADFSRLEFDLGGGFDTSTKTYTIPCSGYWEFDYCLLARNRATGSQYVMGTWYINGATYDRRTFVYFTGQGGGSQESNLIGKIVGYWPAGTTVAVRISQNTANTDVYMYYVYSSFYGKLLH
jgi:hypothetical protein